MNGDDLRAAQAPLKERYRQDPATATRTFVIEATVIDGIACRVDSPRGPIVAGLHPAAGGDGTLACSGDMLLEALAACAGVTLKAVATSLGISIRRATIRAEGDLDFRGTLGVVRDVPIGLTAIRLSYDIDADAAPEQVAKLIQLTERYCVISQTLSHPPTVTHTAARSAVP
ncbi:MAG TPA: OsmC family protein [Gemmataceae bacterium]|jgi:uncharacterized OsmC-like protein|nr:OsmC family protein [Gemmataceae bacterium]